jgi:hypothetical protein
VGNLRIPVTSEKLTLVREGLTWKVDIPESTEPETPGAPGP